MEINPKSSHRCCPGSGPKWHVGQSSSLFFLCWPSKSRSKETIVWIAEVHHYRPGLGPALIAVDRLQVKELHDAAITFGRQRRPDIGYPRIMVSVHNHIQTQNHF